MKPTIARNCDECKKYYQVLAQPGTPLVCPHCQKQWGEVKTLEEVFDFCPVCRCRQFYIQKDFNQALGCVVMLVGIILVPWSYGLSLPLFAGIDWLLHKKVSTMVICYQCLSEFRGFKIREHFKTFMHHIGEKYDR